MRKQILVTGGGGNIGKQLIPYLMNEADVISLDLKPVDAAARSILGSVTDSDLVNDAIRGVDAVLHMAYAFPEPDNYDQQVDVNIKGSVSVLEACVAHRIPRVVFASTVMTVWGIAETPRRPAYRNFDPINFYSFTKCCQELLAEMYTRDHDFISAICLRVGAPVNTPDNPTRLSPDFSMGHGDRVLVAYSDLCEAFRLALLAAPDVKFASVFLVGEYEQPQYSTDPIKETLCLQYQWLIKNDPQVTGAYLAVHMAKQS